MAGSSADRPDDDGIDEVDEPEVDRSEATDRFWTEVDVAPVEIALPAGVGYTLRAYRMNTDVVPSDYTARARDEFVSPRTTVAGLAEDEDEDLFAGEFDEDEDEAVEDETVDDEDAEDDGEADDTEESDESEEDADAAAEAPEEEIPVFLSHAGHLLLFRTRAGLADFVRSDAEHDLTQLDTWPTLVERIDADDVVALPEDTYELDLVVRNLRSGHEGWDAELLVQAGQLARDLGHALRIEPVVLAMAAGSPLDDLDEAMRAAAEGGFGAFRARRRAKKIGVETASIGWRTVIGKISAVADWRD